MIITNHDMAKFAELSTAGSGPIFIGLSDRSVYGAFLRMGYVHMKEGTYHLTLVGIDAAQKWRANPVDFVRSGLTIG